MPFNVLLLYYHIYIYIYIYLPNIQCCVRLIFLYLYIDITSELKRDHDLDT